MILIALIMIMLNRGDPICTYLAKFKDGEEQCIESPDKHLKVELL